MNHNRPMDPRSPRQASPQYGRRPYPPQQRPSRGPAQPNRRQQPPPRGPRPMQPGSQPPQQPFHQPGRRRQAPGRTQTSMPGYKSPSAHPQLQRNHQRKSAPAPQRMRPAAPKRDQHRPLQPRSKKPSGLSKGILIFLDVLIVAIVAAALFFFIKPKIDERNADKLQKEILSKMKDGKHAIQLDIDKNFGKVQGEAVENFGGAQFVDNQADNAQGETVSLTYVGRLVIPKINVVTPLSSDASLPSLRFGVGMMHAPLTENGLTTIWGHRFLTKGRDFNRLDEVTVGDQFYIDYMPTGERYYYTVYQTDIIPWEELEGRIAEYFEDNTAVLVTCHPPVYNEQNERILVYAKPDPDKTTPLPD